MFHCLPDELLRRVSAYQIAELQAYYGLRAREREAEEARRRRDAKRRKGR